MVDTGLQTVYRSVIIAKLTFASSAWLGGGASPVLQVDNDLLSYDEVSRFVQPNQLSFAELCHTADEILFNQILANKTHVHNNLLPPPSVASQSYNLRQRRQ